MDFTTGQWLNPPAEATLSATALHLTTEARTDFWRQTHYGFTRASGHALLFDMPKTYAAEITFDARFAQKYEQAGFLLWHDLTHWIKAGVEYADGQPNLAVVVTRGASDWSMVPSAGLAGPVRLRLSVTPNAVIVHARPAAPGSRWQILRVADFAPAQRARLGPMACSPESAGLRVRFERFETGPLPADPLYLAG